MTAEDSTDVKHDEDLYPEEEVSEGDWMRPQIDIKEVQVVTGEEDEEVFWQHRAKLYRWAKDKASWKERGLGEAKILRHKTTGKLRFLLRQEKTLKIVSNHYVYKRGSLCELQPHTCSDKIFTWSVMDYSDEEPKLQQFALKFGQVSDATDFKKKFEEAVELNAGIFKSGEKGVASEASAPAEAEKTAKDTEKSISAEKESNSENPPSSKE